MICWASLCTQVGSLAAAQANRGGISCSEGLWARMVADLQGRDWLLRWLLTASSWGDWVPLPQEVVPIED